MKAPPVRHPLLRATRNGQSGSTILAALGILAVSLIAVGAALFEASHRFRTSYQSSRWAQAAQAAEAGAEIALMTAQKTSWTADGWSGTPGAPGTPAVSKNIPLSSATDTTGTATAAVSVDKVTMGSSQWLRIRSQGVAAVAGGARAGIDRRDVLLRKLSLRTDRSSGSSLAAPQATRTVEILAEPAFKSPFLRALLLDKTFSMNGGGWIDSFDSRDPTKSTNSQYDVTKRQSNGDVGVNDTGGSSDLGNTFVYGDVAYSGPAIKNTTNVQGEITTPFSEPVSPVLAPDWTTYNATPAVIKKSMTLTGGTKAAPSRYKVSSVALTGGSVLTMAPHAAGVESYIEVWVTGKFTTSGGGTITQLPGVHVTYHIADDVSVSGSSFVNLSNLAANNIVNVITPAAGVSQKVTVIGDGTFVGVMNAPGAALSIMGKADFMGALIGRTITIGGGASVHYDEALSKFTAAGSQPIFRVASFVEAVR